MGGKSQNNTWFHKGYKFFVELVVLGVDGDFKVALAYHDRDSGWWIARSFNQSFHNTHLMTMVGQRIERKYKINYLCCFKYTIQSFRYNHADCRVIVYANTSSPSSCCSCCSGKPPSRCGRRMHFISSALSVSYSKSAFANACNAFSCWKYVKQQCVKLM